MKQELCPFCRSFYFTKNSLRRYIRPSAKDGHHYCHSMNISCMYVEGGGGHDMIARHEGKSMQFLIAIIQITQYVA